jgi:hypothetical protein
MIPNRRTVPRNGLLLAAIAYTLVLGCRDSTPAVVPVTPAGPILSVDEKVLLALDCYEPMYQLDAAGRVIKLRLTGRHLPKAILAEVGKLAELRGLDMYGSSITDEGLAELKDLQNLRALGLGATLVTDQGLVHLEKLQSLQWLWVPGKTVTAAGKEKLQDARPGINVWFQ